MGGWVGGWVGYGKVEEDEAVRTRYCELGVCLGGEEEEEKKRRFIHSSRWVSGWVGLPHKRCWGHRKGRGGSG